MTLSEDIKEELVEFRHTVIEIVIEPPWKNVTGRIDHVNDWMKQSVRKSYPMLL